MGFTICNRCGERLKNLTKKCPKCGLILEKKLSPVLMGIILAGILFALALIGLILF